ncbi:hypothetical protein BN137_3747 [Cronobacter condimenti 1330]|uniref:Uncharacterized protein n=1 Tax=Cronobacter condimenti 1330 TaxID=1073999 RepID=K8AEW6_9ENTR|nr:hypothetical protein BN137_3747 [Cronobacter condimenti 1330]
MRYANALHYSQTVSFTPDNSTAVYKRIICEYAPYFFPLVFISCLF